MWCALSYLGIKTLGPSNIDCFEELLLLFGCGLGLFPVSRRRWETGALFSKRVYTVMQVKFLFHVRRVNRLSSVGTSRTDG